MRTAPQPWPAPRVASTARVAALVDHRIGACGLELCARRGTHGDSDHDAARLEFANDACHVA